LIENFEIRRFEQDPVQKDRIHLDIHMKPYFPAKNFLLKWMVTKAMMEMSGIPNTSKNNYFAHMCFEDGSSFCFCAFFNFEE
jgi:hypothetical protein